MSDQELLDSLENARFELDTTSSANGTGSLIARTADGVLVFRRNDDGSGWSEFDPESAKEGDAVTKITDTALLHLLEAKWHMLKRAVLRITKLSDGAFSVAIGKLTAVCKLDVDKLTPTRVQ